MAGASLGTVWPVADDSRAAAVHPSLGAIAVGAVAMQDSLEAQEGAHTRLDDAASRAVTAADLATSQAQASQTCLEGASAAVDSARSSVRTTEAATESAAAALGEVRAILARIEGRP
jgi:hypothetical protein